MRALVAAIARGLISASLGLYCLPLWACSDRANNADANDHSMDGPVDGGSDEGIAVPLDSCPALEDGDGSGKIFHQAYLRARGAKAEAAAIWLRPLLMPELPDCGAGQDRRTGCADRDAVLEERWSASIQEMNCIIEDAFGVAIGDAFGPNAVPIDWEEPYFLSDGKPVPILTAFQVPIDWELAQRVAAHPYVERIEPPVGQVPFLGVEAPPAPAHCPHARESAEGKVVDVPELQGPQRDIVAIEVDNRALPAMVACSDPESTCKAEDDAEWERYLLNTRNTTCILRELDALVGADAFPDTYLSVTGNGLTTPLPPLGNIPNVINEFGRALTRDEIQQIARHPYVKAVRGLYEDGGVANPPEQDCPIDTTAPIPTRECSTERESTEGKWTPQDEALWEIEPGPHEVSIVVTGGGKICPVTCPPLPSDCPEQDETIRYLESWNLESQRCVRELIATLGGEATDEVLWLVNSVDARLTFEQILAVGQNPQVQSITNAMSNSPPP